MRPPRRASPDTLSARQTFTCRRFTAVPCPKSASSAAWSRPVVDTDGNKLPRGRIGEIVDRLKDMIITGGENVYSIEVEHALANHPGVAGCAVIGIPSDEWGESIHAFVVRKASHEVTVEDLDAHCRALIANHKCPKSIDFVDALPLSGAGKVLKVKLREPFWQQRSRRIS